MVMIEPTVRYEVKLQGGVAKSLFGGEGLFLVHMTGPGHVTLQTLPFSRTARRVLAAAGGGQGESGVGGLLRQRSSNRRYAMGFSTRRSRRPSRPPQRRRRASRTSRQKRELSQAYGELGKTRVRAGRER